MAPKKLSATCPSCADAARIRLPAERDGAVTSSQHIRLPARSDPVSPDPHIRLPGSAPDDQPGRSTRLHTTRLRTPHGWGPARLLAILEGFVAAGQRGSLPANLLTLADDAAQLIILNRPDASEE